MKITGNTIVITGGGSGIGRGLAEALQAEGNRIIIAGRRKQLLDEVTAANPNMHSLTLDIGDAAAIKAFARHVSEQFPTLNVVIHNAGMMKMEDVQAGGEDTADAEATIATNLLGPIRLTSALLPLLKRQTDAAIITVSSGLAFVPMAATPTYSATKAALHSYTQSLRYQLQNTAIEVLELIPPYVQTELTGKHQASDPRAMPLDAFIKESIEILKTHPASGEICVNNVLPLRFAEKNGNHAVIFQTLNDQMSAAGASR